MLSDRRNRWVYLDVCRVIAIFGVVFTHVVASQWSVDPLGSRDWTVLNAYFSLFRFSIPLFFMISGVLLLDPERPPPLKKIYGASIPRLVICLLFWGSLYYLIVIYRWAPEEFAWKRFITEILGGHPYQHWFLFKMIGLYMALPILRKIARDRKLCRYFLLLWGIFVIGLVSVWLTLTFFEGVDSPILYWLTQIYDFADRIIPNVVVGFSGYMLLGYYLHNTDVKQNTRFLLLSLGVVGIALTTFANQLASMRANARMETFFDDFAITVCVMAMGVFVNIKSLLSKSVRPHKVLAVVSSCSFGVYLVHDLILVFFLVQSLFLWDLR